MAHHVPRAGTAVDIGGGLGGNARWLAARGLAVTLIDASDIGLARAAEFDQPEGEPIEYLCRDVEAEGLPARTWTVALMHLFFVPTLVTALPAHLEPGGVFLVCQPTVTNLERHDKPGRRFLLETGQIHQLAAALEGTEILEASEGWRASGRHDAWLVARRR